MILSLPNLLLSCAPATQAVPVPNIVPRNDVPANEADYYAVDYLTPPDKTRVEVGGMDFLSNGRMLVSTRRGQVWLIDNALAKDPKDAHFTLFAEGLQEGLGLKVVGEKIYVLQRAELSELIDNDHDDRCDEVRRVANDWGVSGHYHEFAFGLPRDKDGNFFISLNVSFGDPQWWHGRSTVEWRGWILKLTPEGKTIPFASGFRSPCGLGMNLEGDLFETDNQGDWMPACPIYHIKQDGFYGHPASLNWTPSYREAKRTASDTIPPTTQRQPAAVWIPYDWSRSAGSLVAADTHGKFGPFDGQFFVAELTNGMVFRAMLEKVRGEYQGAVLPFRQHVGSAVRVSFAPDGTLFAGFTDRGWGGQAPGDGVGRIRPTGRLPMEIEKVHLVDDGFEVRFTQPLREAPPAGAVKLFEYDYDYWWEYGSPARHQATVPVMAVMLSPDKRTAHLITAGLKAGMCVRVRFEGVASESGERLLHEEFAYTINQLTSGPASTELVAKLVPPPPAKERSSEGMLELTSGDALDSWIQTGWHAESKEIGLDPGDKHRLAFHGEADANEGSVLINDGATPSELVSRLEFADIDVHAEFMLPEGGNSGLYLMGRYEVQLLDSSGKTDLKPGDCGGIYEAWGEGHKWPGRAPMFNAFRGPGQWHGLSVRFRAPKFDASGRKVSNALFERVMIDDVLLQENVEVPEPTRGALESPREVASGPLRFQGDHGQVAFKNIWVRRPTVPPEPPSANSLAALPMESTPLAKGWTYKEGVLTAADGAEDLVQLFLEESDVDLSS
ncbi:MAG: family 16 glycoside hydrolase, partial [Planctomycetota bacterium]